MALRVACYLLISSTEAPAAEVGTFTITILAAYGFDAEAGRRPAF